MLSKTLIELVSIEGIWLSRDRFCVTCASSFLTFLRFASWVDYLQNRGNYASAVISYGFVCNEWPFRMFGS